MQIQYNCELCDAHKTDLGTLKEIAESVNGNFGYLNEVLQWNLIIAWFKEYKSDQRMKYIEASKNKTTEKIQAYKQKNMDKLAEQSALTRG